MGIKYSKNLNKIITPDKKFAASDMPNVKLLFNKISRNNIEINIKQKNSIKNDMSLKYLVMITHYLVGYIDMDHRNIEGFTQFFKNIEHFDNPNNNINLKIYYPFLLGNSKEDIIELHEKIYKEFSNNNINEYNRIKNLYNDFLSKINVNNLTQQNIKTLFEIYLAVNEADIKYLAASLNIELKNDISDIINLINKLISISKSEMDTLYTDLDIINKINQKYDLLEIKFNTSLNDNELEDVQNEESTEEDSTEQEEDSTEQEEESTEQEEESTEQEEESTDKKSTEQESIIELIKKKLTIKDYVLGIVILVLLLVILFK